SEVGAELAVGFGSFDRVTVDAGGREENVAPYSYLRFVCSVLLLRGNPLFKLAGLMHDHPDQHSSVLCAAILPAIAEVCPGSRRFYQHAIRPVWFDISLSFYLHNQLTNLHIPCSI